MTTTAIAAAIANAIEATTCLNAATATTIATGNATVTLIIAFAATATATATVDATATAITLATILAAAPAGGPAERRKGRRRKTEAATVPGGARPNGNSYIYSYCSSNILLQRGVPADRPRSRLLDDALFLGAGRLKMDAGWCDMGMIMLWMRVERSV